MSNSSLASNSSLGSILQAALLIEHSVHSVDSSFAILQSLAIFQFHDEKASLRLSNTRDSALCAQRRNMAHNGMTDEDTEVILQLLQNDVEEILQNQKGKQKEGEETETDANLKTVISELQAQIMLLTDRRLAQSITNAVCDDGAVLTLAMQEEARATDDRRLALRLAGHNEEPPQNNEQLENEAFEQLKRLAIVKTDNEHEGDAYGCPAEVYNGESSRQAGHSSDRPTSLIECDVCTERKFNFDTIRVPCGHVYCRDCIIRLFTDSLIDESLFPPRCCRQTISLSRVRIFLSIAQIAACEEKFIEVNDPSRTYCSRATCSKYIPPTRVQMYVGVCEACNTRTCVLCKREAHDGECPDETEEVLEMARERGWRQCYRCGTLVELSYGCNHMT